MAVKYKVKQYVKTDDIIIVAIEPSTTDAVALDAQFVETSACVGAGIGVSKYGMLIIPANTVSFSCVAKANSGALYSSSVTVANLAYDAELTFSAVV